MTKLEKVIYVGCPWFFGVVLIICGLLVKFVSQATLEGLMLICTGVICMSLCCLSSLLAKIVESK